MQEEQGRIRDIFEVNIRQNREPETRETGLQSTGKVGAKRSVLGMLLGSLHEDIHQVAG